MWLSDFYEMKKKEATETGSAYTLATMCQELGTTYQKIHRLLSGSNIINIKTADSFEKITNGVLVADELLEISIQKHRKFLERKKKFGDLNSRKKKMREEILGNGD